MDKKLLEQALQIASENPNNDPIKALPIPSAPIADHYKAVYRNIKLFLDHDKVLQNKYKCLNSALEGLGAFGGKNKKIINQRIETLKATMETMHQQLLSWWTDYENCPISIKVGNTPVGETVCFGYYECFKENYKKIMSKISWKVLTKLQDRALLISDCILDVTSYSSLQYEAWPTCNLRKWCQDLYAKNFTNAERQYIFTTNVRTPDNQYGTVTTDKIFILSATEIQKYMPTQSDRYTRLTQCAEDSHFTAWECFEDVVPHGRRLDGWWTRSPSNNPRNAACVLDHFTTQYRANSLGIPITESRKIHGEGLKICPMGIRPALWVKIE